MSAARPLMLPESPAGRARAMTLLRDGALVALPTETVYGLAARADDDDAVARVFAAKGRPANRPLPVLVASFDDALALWAPGPWLDPARALADAFWPGPLTIICPQAGGFSPLLHGGTEALGVRCPDHAHTLELLRTLALPVAAPSANPSEAPSPTTAEEVRTLLGDRVDAILESGASQGGMESTIVALHADGASLVRAGAIARSALNAVLGAGWRLPETPHAPHPRFDAAPVQGVATLALDFEARSLRWKATSVDALIRGLHARLSTLPEELGPLRRWQASADLQADPRFEGIQRLLTRYLRED